MTAKLNQSEFEQLAAQYGLDESYYNYRGQWQQFSASARQAIVAAMRGNNSAAEPVWVRTVQEKTIRVPLPASSSVQLHAALESGEERHWQSALHVTDQPQYSQLELPDLPLGYHRLHLSADHQRISGTLIITPTRCDEPASMQQGARYWGLSIQLYTLRTEHNLGIGDFADLQALIKQAAPLGCATIGLNPLHALRPADPAHISPYSPSHRDFLNVLYIAPCLAEEFHARVVQEFMVSHHDAWRALRASDQVNYSAVARLKLKLMKLMFELLVHYPARGQAFKQYVERAGEALQRHALYDALDEHFSRQPNRQWGWRSWPREYHDSYRTAVQAFAKAHPAQIEFYLYLQWLAAIQLQQCQQLAQSCGMSLGLYGDVAVGVDANGSEVWSNRQLYLENVSVGAPPDPLALKGQDWGIPPQHPLKLTHQAYAPFIRLLRANMQAAGALRIDHVMSLYRLWWVPRGFEATQGVYVHYPLDDLVKILALESVRNQCLVIGEDLGTVPDAMRDAMQRYGLYHYKVLSFEKQRDGSFIAPDEYLANSLAVVTTHDLPPFKSWWQNDDIRLRAQLQLYPDAATEQTVLSEREHDKHQFMQALTRAGLWHWQVHEPLPHWSFALMRAAYLYAGLSQAKLLVIQPEDLQGMIDPVNVPGTSIEHANWQRKLDADLMETLKRADVTEMLQAMNKARRGEFPNNA